MHGEPASSHEDARQRIRDKETTVMWEWHSGWGWWWMGVAMLVFWGLVAWVVVTLVRQGDRSSSGKRGAREILDERYARGEIDDDEYRRRSEPIAR